MARTTGAMGVQAVTTAAAEAGRALRSHAAWLASEIERLETLIRPAPAAVVDDTVRLMLNSFGGGAGGETHRVASYMIALDGFSARAITAAVRRVLRGEAEGLDRRFPPTAPQLAALCRDAESRDRQELALRRTQLERERNPPPREPTPEERARIAEGLAGLSRELAVTSAERSLGETLARVVGGAADAAAEGEA